jgi:hypothetical protein
MGGLVTANVQAGCFGQPGNLNQETHWLRARSRNGDADGVTAQMNSMEWTRAIMA